DVLIDGSTRSGVGRRFREPAAALLTEDRFDLVRGDGALADDAPAVGLITEVDDGGGDAARRLTAVDDERDAVAELLLHTLRAGALAGTAEIGRGRGDGMSHGFAEGDRNRGGRNPQRDVPSVCGDL